MTRSSLQTPPNTIKPKVGKVRGWDGVVLLGLDLAFASCVCLDGFHGSSNSLNRNSKGLSRNSKGYYKKVSTTKKVREREKEMPIKTNLTNHKKRIVPL